MEKKTTEQELNIGWIDSWQLKNKKDVHPSHAMQVIDTKDVLKFLARFNHDYHKMVVDEFKKLCKED